MLSYSIFGQWPSLGHDCCTGWKCKIVWWMYKQTWVLKVALYLSCNLGVWKFRSKQSVIHANACDCLQLRNLMANKCAKPMTRTRGEKFVAGSIEDAKLSVRNSIYHFMRFLITVPKGRNTKTYSLQNTASTTFIIVKKKILTGKKFTLKWEMRMTTNLFAVKEDC